jgi:hypothetical protein
MRKLTKIAILVSLGSCLAFAQDVPKYEFFGGASYVRVNPTGLDGVNTSGWETSLNYNLGRHWGLKADFSGHYCCAGEHLHTFLAGPQFSWRKDKATFFVHGLIGGAHVSASTSDRSVAWVAGGGFDWQLTDHWSWRVVQTDYLGTHFLASTQHNFRASTGLVVRFGGTR